MQVSGGDQPGEPGHASTSRLQGAGHIYRAAKNLGNLVTLCEDSRAAVSAYRCLWERDLIEEELQSLMHHFDGIATASYRRGMSIISLICNVQRTSQILERVSEASLYPACCLPVCTSMISRLLNMAACPLNVFHRAAEVQAWRLLCSTGTMRDLVSWVT